MASPEKKGLSRNSDKAKAPASGAKKTLSQNHDGKKKPVTRKASKTETRKESGPTSQRKGAQKKSEAGKTVDTVALNKKIKSGNGSAKVIVIDAAQQSDTISSHERRLMIAEAAYFKAERNGFRDADHQKHWYDAEAEIDAMIFNMIRES